MRILFAILLSLAPVAHGMLGCSKLTDCSCKSSEGIIDLSPLGKRDGTPRFRDVHDNENFYEYSWNPCYVFSEGPPTANDNACSDVAICQHEIGKQIEYYTGGKQDTAEFVVNGAGELSIIYGASGSSGFPRVSNVKLICDPETDFSFTVQGEMPASSGHYFMTLRSVYACPRGVQTTPHSVPPTPPSFFNLETIFFILCGICFLLFVAVLLFIIFGSILLSRGSSNSSNHCELGQTMRAPASDEDKLLEQRY